jgi:hypothetical protein
VSRGQHFHRFAIEEKAAGDQALSKVEPLRDVGYSILGQRRAVQGQAQLGEVQAMRVAAQVLDRARPALAARNAARRGFGVGHVPAHDPEAVEGLIQGEAFGIGLAAPSPLRLRPERNAALVQFGEGLQTGGVDGEGELAVAHRQGGENVQAPDLDGVSGEQRISVDDGSRIGHGCRERAPTACRSISKQRQALGGGLVAWRFGS